MRIRRQIFTVTQTNQASYATKAHPPPGFRPKEGENQPQCGCGKGAVPGLPGTVNGAYGSLEFAFGAVISAGTTAWRAVSSAVRMAKNAGVG